MKPTIAISLGDPAGIGPEITIASLEAAKQLCTPVLFGHWPTFEAICRQMQHPTDGFDISNTVSSRERRGRSNEIAGEEKRNLHSYAGRQNSGSVDSGAFFAIFTYTQRCIQLQYFGHGVIHVQHVAIGSLPD